MERLTQQQLQTLLEFVRGCYACHDQEAFIRYLLHRISTLIPAESTSYAEISLESGKLLDATRVEPAHVEFPEARQIFKHYFLENPFVTYRQHTRDGSAIKISDFLTQRQFHRLGLYNELFRLVDKDYQMTVSLATPSQIEIQIGFGRSRRDFSERDRLLLNLVRPHLVQAYQNAQAIMGMQEQAALLRRTMEMGTQGLVVLAKEGRVRLMTQQARAWLSTYFGPPRRADHLPDTLRAWITHQEIQLKDADDAPPPRTPLVVERNGARLTVRHLCEADQCLLLMEELQTTVVSASLAPLGLTRRETEVLHWVAQGKTNTEIGVILSLSSRTVQKHLEHIFKKLGVEMSRGIQFSLVMGIENSLPLPSPGLSH